MKQKPDIFIKDKVYINTELVPLKRVVQYYEQHMYEENRCFKCYNKPDRPNETCEICPSYLGHVKLWDEVEVAGKDYYAIPSGHLKRVQKVLKVDLSEAKDYRKEIPLSFNLKFKGELYKEGDVDENGKLRPNQVKIVEQWLKKKSGILESPPRVGKTVMGVYITCKLGQKTLIVANREKLLKQFRKRFEENTNILAVEKKLGRQICGIVKNIEDLDKYEIALVSYQKFIRGTGEERIAKYISGRFSLLTVDEVHSVAADAYALFVNRLPIRYKLGLTATPTRKDGKFFIVRDIMGPVVAKSFNPSAMLPRIELWETGIKPKHEINTWVYAIKFLCQQEERNNAIVRQVFADLRAGHKAIIIPVTFKDYMRDLVTMINRQARINRVKKGENWPKKLAVCYHSKANQDKVIEGIESGDHRVMVAIMMMVKEGLDFEAPSVVINPIPTSNPGMFYQLANRCCTSYKGKPQPIFRYMVDDMPQSYGCFKSLFRKEIMPRLKDKEDARKRYLMADKDFKRSLEMIRNKVYVPDLSFKPERQKEFEDLSKKKRVKKEKTITRF